LVILGVLCILAGASMFASAQDKVQDAEEFNDKHCTTDFNTGERSCPDNPYMKRTPGLFWVGLSLVVIGGVILNIGTR
jgi:hypothetical protein